MCWPVWCGVLLTAACIASASRAQPGDPRSRRRWMDGNELQLEPAAGFMFCCLAASVGVWQRGKGHRWGSSNTLPILHVPWLASSQQHISSLSRLRLPSSASILFFCLTLSLTHRGCAVLCSLFPPALTHTCFISFLTCHNSVSLAGGRLPSETRRDWHKSV